jgi:hypothetical protein
VILMHDKPLRLQPHTVLLDQDQRRAHLSASVTGLARHKQKEPTVV